MVAAPDSRPSATAVRIGASRASVASSSSLRLRARSWARAGWRRGDEPFAGVVGVDDLGQVLLVEQRHLQWPAVGG
jgi:hypothetical protein